MRKISGNKLLSLLALLLAFAGAFGVGVAVDDDNDGKPDRFLRAAEKPDIPAAVGVDGPDADRKVDDALVLDREAREVAQNAQATPENFDLSGDLRGPDKTPVGVPIGPLASQNWPGCTTRFLPTNYSNRVSTVKAVGVHYTAGGNRFGLSDMNGLTAYASSPAAGVSWHFLIDAEGNCYYNVPVDRKSWTIGGLNSETVNIEVIGRGNEPEFPAGAGGKKKLSQVIARIARVYDFPVRLGAVSNCKVTRTGVITHWMGGACSGGHVDIKPYDLNRVIKAAQQSVCGAECQARKRRTTDLRIRHQSTHKTIRNRGCNFDRPKAAVCVKLVLRNKAIHAAAKKEKIKL